MVKIKMSTANNVNKIRPLLNSLGRPARSEHFEFLSPFPNRLNGLLENNNSLFDKLNIINISGYFKNIIAFSKFI